MASRGKPLPFAVREQIKDYRRRRISERRIAILLGLHRATVRKYSKNVPASQYAA